MRQVQTFAHLPPQEGLLTPELEASMLTTMEVGSLVVQSPLRAASNGRQMNAAPRARTAMRAPSLSSPLRAAVGCRRR